MNAGDVELSRIIRVHYGAALKEAERVQSGPYDVFGSSGVVGRHSECLFDYPSIVIGRKGSVGAVSYAIRGGWAIDTAFYVERLDPSRCDLRYLFYALDNAHLARHTITTSIPGLSRDDIYRTRIRLPSLTEQKNVAAILDKADGIRRKRREALKLTDELLRSTFLEMCCLGHPHYASWPLASIESLAKQSAGAIRSGPFGSALLHSEFVDEGIAVLGIDNAVKNRFAWDERRFVTPEKYEELRRYTVHPGDVIITIMGTTGRSAVVPDDIPLAITTKHLATITPDASRVTPEFLAFSIHTNPDVLQQIAKANRGAIMAGLNLGLIRALSVRVPPIAVQRTFTHFVRAHGQLRQRQEHALSEAESLLSSLSQQFFSPSPSSSKREAA